MESRTLPTARAATGGTSPYSWSVVSTDSNGNPLFPPGLTLDASTGVITGSPTQNANGQYTFTVKVTVDGLDGVAAEKTFVIAVDGLKKLEPPHRYVEN